MNSIRILLNRYSQLPCKNKNLCLQLVFVFLAVPMMSQVCIQNSNHPDYQTIEQVLSTETIIREYILHIPADYDNNNPSPLVICMHGFGGCAADFSELVGGFYSLDSIADSENFIVAYPQAAYRPAKDDVYWEPGDNEESNIYSNDVYFIEELIDKINTDYNVDLDRVYASGYSNGGMMAYSLACTKADLFAAIGIMSGVMLDESCTAGASIPIIKFHGIEDDVLPYNGNLWYQSVSEVVNFWLDLNNIPNNNIITTQLNDGKVIRDEYFGGNNNSCFVLYTINEEWEKPGGHVWFSDKINGTIPNEILWDFFSKGCSTISSTEEEMSKQEKIECYPNPVADLLTVENNFKEFQNVNIYNIDGKLEMTAVLNSKANTINLNSLNPHVYILQVGNQFIKFIKID